MARGEAACPQGHGIVLGWPCCAWKHRFSYSLKGGLQTPSRLVRTLQQVGANPTEPSASDCWQHPLRAVALLTNCAPTWPQPSHPAICEVAEEKWQGMGEALTTGIQLPMMCVPGRHLLLCVRRSSVGAVRGRQRSATRAHHRALCPAVHAQGCTLSNGHHAQRCTLSKSRVAQLVPAPFALPRAPLLLVEREAKVCSKEIRAASLIGSPALLAWQYPLPGPEGNRQVTAASKASEPPVQACNFSSRKQSLLGRTP